MKQLTTLLVVVITSFFALCYAGSLRKKSALENLPEYSDQTLIDCYQKLLRKIKKGCLVEVERHLYRNATQLALAVNKGLATESLTFIYGIEKRFSRSLGLMELLADYGIEGGNMRSFRAACENASSQLEVVSDHVIELYKFGLIEMEDFWIILAKFSVRDGPKLLQFMLKKGANVNQRIVNEVTNESKSVLAMLLSNAKWKLALRVIEEGADVNQRIVDKATNGSKTVLAMLLSNTKLKLALRLIKGGANVNIPPAEGYANIWQFALDFPICRRHLDFYLSKGKYADLLCLIASRTKDLALKKDNRWTEVKPNSEVYDEKRRLEIVDDVLSREIQSRLIRRDVITRSEGDSLLDMATLYRIQPLWRTVAVLRKAGCTSRYPLTVSALTYPTDKFKALVMNGTANFAEEFVPGTHILQFLINRKRYGHVKILIAAVPDLPSELANNLFNSFIRNWEARYSSSIENELLQMLAYRADFEAVQSVLSVADDLGLSEWQKWILRLVLMRKRVNGALSYVFEAEMDTVFRHHQVHPTPSDHPINL